MEEQNPARHPNVPSNYGLLCFVGWCQGLLASLTMSPTDYDEYLRITWHHYDKEPFNDVFVHQMVQLLQGPDYTHLQVYWDVLYCHFTGVVQVEENPLYFFPVALCGVLNVIICVALFGSLRNLPRCRARTLSIEEEIALEVERLRKELRELDAVAEALLLILRSDNRIEHTDDAATISRARELIRQYRDRTEWTREEFLDRMPRESR